MSKPMAICLENLLFQDEEERYLCCAVKPGRVPGLSVDNKGTTRWLVNDDPAFMLFVTMDDCLALYRVPGGVPVQVRRARRTLDAPFEKPVILLGGDELSISGRRYRVYTHGWTEKTYAPYYLKEHLKKAMKTAAAFMVGATLTTAACDTIDVREQPPAMVVESTDSDAGPETDMENDAGTDPDAATDTAFDSWKRSTNP